MFRSLRGEVGFSTDDVPTEPLARGEWIVNEASTWFGGQKLAGRIPEDYVIGVNLAFWETPDRRGNVYQTNVRGAKDRVRGLLTANVIEERMCLQFIFTPTVP